MLSQGGSTGFKAVDLKSQQHMCNTGLFKLGLFVPVFHGNLILFQPCVSYVVGSFLRKDFST